MTSLEPGRASVPIQQALAKMRAGSCCRGWSYVDGNGSLHDGSCQYHIVLHTDKLLDDLIDCRSTKAGVRRDYLQAADLMNHSSFRLAYICIPDRCGSSALYSDNLCGRPRSRVRPIEGSPPAETSAFQEPATQTARF